MTQNNAVHASQQLATLNYFLLNFEIPEESLIFNLATKVALSALPDFSSLHQEFLNYRLSNIFQFIHCKHVSLLIAFIPSLKVCAMHAISGSNTLNNLHNPDALHLPLTTLITIVQDTFIDQEEPFIFNLFWWWWLFLVSFDFSCFLFIEKSVDLHAIETLYLVFF